MTVQAEALRRAEGWAIYRHYFTPKWRHGTKEGKEGGLP